MPQRENNDHVLPAGGGRETGVYPGVPANCVLPEPVECVPGLHHPGRQRAGLARIRTPENIDNSRRICSRYQPGDLDNLKRLFCLLVESLEGKFHDFLGSVFMELELGNSKTGQFFTPYPLARLIAGLTAGDEQQQQLKTCPWVTLSEPTSGAGGMVIAFAEVMLARGLNPAEQLLVTATDIDPLAADMTFIQLSLLGIPAIVNTGNSLALTVNRTRYTPVYYFNNWEARIRLHERIQAMRAFLS